MAGGKFREHRRQVAASSLHPTGCDQFRKEANEHAQSLPSAAPDGKCGCIGVSGMPNLIAELRVGGTAEVFAVFLKF